MRNKLFIILISFFWAQISVADSINIQSSTVQIDKDKEITTFKGSVKVVTEDGNTIKSEYAEYNKKLSFIIFKDKVEAVDKKNNKVVTNYAEYDDLKGILRSKGETKVITSEKYIIESEDIELNNKKNFIRSEKSTLITDQDNNKIYLQNFEYLAKENIFKSVGLIKIKDNKKNSYEFSQIYIDEKKKEIIGSDIKAFLNDDQFKIHKDNNPRIFANTLSFKNKNKIFNKSIFTLCSYRENEKCPPWTLQASKMKHDSIKKTIYYDNAVIKVFDFPIFYTPKLSHPDPTVDRRSGFLPPTFSDSKNLGSGINIPYFWAVSEDKNFTVTPKFYVSENPLFLAQYNQAFKNSNLLFDFGFTEGYKKTSSSKRPGKKSHYFLNYMKNFLGNNNSQNTLNLSLQEVSNDKYLKLYKIKSNLVDYNNDTLENFISFTHQDEDIFFGFNSSVYETLKDNYNDKYEYILPEITFNKNLLTDNQFGSIDLQTNLKVHNYDTNKFSKFLVNDFDINLKETLFENGIKGKFISKFKNINYETKNIDIYKDETTNEMYGAVGYLAEIDLKKQTQNGFANFLTPKVLFRYSPGNMRKETVGSRLDPINAFSLDRLNNINNFENGLSATYGFDFKSSRQNKEFDFSIAQVLNQKENKKMPTKTSLDEKISDLVGKSNYKINKNISLNYNFSIDQNYNELVYNEIGSNINLDPIMIDFNYLQESKHLGDQEYFETKVNVANNRNSLVSFGTKRNLVTDSAEFYNLSYEYFNDCLRAGIVYRREFYNDSEIEPENSLFFKITLTPFGNINSPSFNQ